MRYLIRINFSKLSSKKKNKFLDLFNQPKYKNYIIKQTENEIIIMIPLFDVLIYKIENKVFSKGLRISLLKQDIVNNKVTKEIDFVKVNSEDYDALLRQIRF